MINIEDHVYNAIQEVLSDRHMNVRFDNSTLMGSIIDSMGVLEVLLVLEENGIETKFIDVADISDVNSLIKILKL